MSTDTATKRRTINDELDRLERLLNEANRRSWSGGMQIVVGHETESFTRDDSTYTDIVACMESTYARLEAELEVLKEYEKRMMTHA